RSVKECTTDLLTQSHFIFGRGTSDQRLLKSRRRFNVGKTLECGFAFGFILLHLNGVGMLFFPAFAHACDASFRGRIASIAATLTSCRDLRAASCTKTKSPSFLAPTSLTPRIGLEC